jgi:hypothetical protein
VAFRKEKRKKIRGSYVLCIMEENNHLAHEMMVIEPGEKPTRLLTWKP